MQARGFALTVLADGFSTQQSLWMFGRKAMRRSIWMAVPALLLVAGCASPESRVRSSLVRIGLPYNAADCLAQNVASKLSSQQIKDLSRLSGLSEHRVGEMSVRDFTGMLTRSGNLEMVELFARAGLGCAIIG